MTTPATVGKPFTPETARQAARSSAALRRERAATRRRYSDTLDYLAETFGDRGKLGPLAFQACAELIVAAIDGEIPVPETPLDRLRLAETARILHGIGRLELGESTSNSAVVRLEMSSADREAALQGLRERLDALARP